MSYISFLEKLVSYKNDCNLFAELKIHLFIFLLLWYLRFESVALAVLDKRMIKNQMYSMILENNSKK